MSWEILIHPEVAHWLEGLPQESYEKVIMTLEALSHAGPTLGRPQVDRIHNSRLHNLKELRPLGTTYRILFAFDFKRRAILLAAGDKESRWKTWYKENIAIAENRFILFNDHQEEDN